MYVNFVYDSSVTKNNDPLLHYFGDIVSMKINLLKKNGSELLTKINRFLGGIVSGGSVAKWQKDLVREKVGSFVTDIDMHERDCQFLDGGFLSRRTLFRIFDTHYRSQIWKI